MCILLLAGCQPKEEKRLDTDFEGSITYQFTSWESKEKDSAKAMDTRSYFPIDTMICYIDEGCFLTKMSSRHEDLDYQYTNPHINKSFMSMTDTDTLFVNSGEKPQSWETPLLDVSQAFNTDTILGHICHSLTLKYKDRTQTLIYSPDLPTNPEWYQSMKMNNTHIKYKHMKAYFLGEKFESKEFNYTTRAIRIIPGNVPSLLFPMMEKVKGRPQVSID